MKTVTGKLVSTKTLSLSNATKYMTRFTSSDNGASHVAGIYLQRATDSFNNLVNLKRNKKKDESEVEEVEKSLGGEERRKRKVNGEGTIHLAEQSGKKKKKRRQIQGLF